MTLYKLLIIALFCFIFAKSEQSGNDEGENQEHIPHISSVLNYLNSNPNKVYEYKKGVLLSAQNKNDVVEVTVEVDVDCSNKYPEIPCNERALICHAFVGRNPDQGETYQVLSDVRCNPKVEIIVEEIEDEKSAPPMLFGEQTQGEMEKIDLSNEALSPEQGGADFVAVRRNNMPCLGCPFDLNVDAEGVDELIATAVKHIESERSQRHKIINVRRLQQQVVAGLKYILLADVAQTTCPKDADLSAPCILDTSVEPFTCEVVFIQKPWISKSKHIIKNNCTVSQEFEPLGLSKRDRDDIDNDILPHEDLTNPRQKDSSKSPFPNFNEIAQTGNMEEEMDAARLADLESQIILGDMIQSPKVESPRNLLPPRFVQPDYIAVEEPTPITTDFDGLSVEPLNNEYQPLYRAPFFMSVPVVDENEPVVTMYQYQNDEPIKSSDENVVNKDQFTEFDSYLPIQERLKRELNGDSGSESDSDSSSSNENKKKDRQEAEATTVVDIVKREVDKSSEETPESINTSEAAEENKDKRIKRETPSTSEEKDSAQSDKTDEKKNKRTKRANKKDDDNNNSSSSSSSSSSDDDDDDNNDKNDNDKKRKEKLKKSRRDDDNEVDSNNNNHNGDNNKDDDSSSSSSSSSSDEDDKDQRHRRSIGQMEKISPDEKVIVRDLADFAAATLDSIDDDHHKRVILQILGAKKLKLDGIYYQIILRLGISHCHENEHNENCREKLFTNLTKICKVQVHVDEDYSNPKVVKSQCQNIKKDENDRNRTNYSRYRRSVLVGGHTPVDINDPYVKKYVNTTLQHLDSTSDHPNKHKAVEIISATSQIVAGVRYVVTAKIGLSNCKKTENKLPETCETLQDSIAETCTIDVWDRPWLNKTIYRINCGNNTFQFGDEDEDGREKREVLGGPEELSKEHVEARKFVKMALEYFTLKSESLSKYEIKNINKVTRRIVAGSLWNIEADIVPCREIDLLRVTHSMCPDESQYISCKFTVLDQPWLVDGLKISASCDNDDNVYVYEPVKEFNEELGYSHIDFDKAFKQFMRKYNKVYGDSEYNYRSKVFRDNLNKIALLNKYEKGTGRYGITQFADMTEKEFSQSHGYRADLQNENELPFAKAEIPNVNLPKDFDWRTKNAVTEVKNQGLCGSCWAFSVTGNVEGQYAIKHGKLLEFSEQELVDCDKVDQGCNGGLMDNAYRVIEKLGGLETESDYPYEGDDEKCHFNPGKVRVELTGALNISHNETDMAKWLVQNGPISIAINANAMQFYLGGVSHPWKMLCNPNNLDHGVLIVGYGVDKYSLFNKTLPYWIVKNSWGSSWGEQGYYRVYRGDGTCGLNQTPSSAVVAQ